jgi:hypothetical protein
MDQADRAGIDNHPIREFPNIPLTHSAEIAYMGEFPIYG